MKNIKIVVIVVLIASNALFIWAYAKKQNDILAANLSLKNAREQAAASAEQARLSQEMAQQNEEHARHAVELSNEHVELLKKQLKECKK